MAKMSVVLMKDEEWNPGESDHDAGFGALNTESGPLPLKALDVRAEVTGLLYHLTLRQTFVNTHGRVLEATYIFPLPDRAAVSRFLLRVAGRVIEGQLKERGEARREYNQAIAKGHRAAIAEEERPGVFTMRAGNIPPGETAEVELSMDGPLSFIDGEATLRFPLVVAPRYIPGVALPGESVGSGIAADTHAVPDASRISPPVLLPGWKSPVRLGLEVCLDPAGLPFFGVRSSLHTTVLSEDNAGRLTLRVMPGERLDRDFVLRFRVGEDTIATALTLFPDEELDARAPTQKKEAGGWEVGDVVSAGEGTFSLTLLPPQLPERAAQRARDVIFVLDRSGSMEGWKMVAARRAMARMVDTLVDRDRFAVYAFDNEIETIPGVAKGALMSGSDRNRFRAQNFLSRIEARGGTEMGEPLQNAAEKLVRSEGRSPFLVLVTDGQVGNEAQILRALGEKLKHISVFTLGIDRAVNESFLRQLATLGGGGCEIVESEDRLDEVMDRVQRQIGTPVLTAVKLKAAGMELDLSSLTPARLPDLYAETPVVIYGRYRGLRGESLGSIEVHGVGADRRERTLKVQAVQKDTAAIAKLWARGHVRDLEDRIAAGDRSANLRDEIIETSLRFQVLCKFTSFVAVDRVERVNPGGSQHKMTQPVESPQGWGQESAARPGTPRQAAGRPAAPMSPPPAARARVSAAPDMQFSLAEAKEVVSFDDDAAPDAVAAPMPARAPRAANYGQMPPVSGMASAPMLAPNEAPLPTTLSASRLASAEMERGAPMARASSKRAILFIVVLVILLALGWLALRFLGGGQRQSMYDGSWPKSYTELTAMSGNGQQPDAST